METLAEHKSKSSQSGYKSIPGPYVVFLGDAPDRLAAKTAIGIAEWHPGNCVGQIRLPGCQATAGLKDVSLKEAYAAGAQTLVIGVANRGGVIAQAWQSTLLDALDHGLNIASGLHTQLSESRALVERAHKRGVSLIDVRRSDHITHIATGERRGGKRLLTVGTDCSCGKMYTSLALHRAMKKAGLKSSFRATGQTGILIEGSGVCVDAVKADFISGAVELLSPANQDDHWDVIEGQGSLYHPSFAGVSLGLLHGAQADVLILCHEPTRTHMRGLSDYSLPSIEQCIEANLSAARLTNSNVKMGGISINTHNLGVDDAKRLIGEYERNFKLPITDPYRFGAEALLEHL